MRSPADLREGSIITKRDKKYSQPPDPKYDVLFRFFTTAEQAALIHERMASIGVGNLSAYLRKVAIDGYIINLDLSDVREMVSLLRRCSNNLNQYAKRANETGSIYAADIEDLRVRLDQLWDAASGILGTLAEVK